MRGAKKSIIAFMLLIIYIFSALPTSVSADFNGNVGERVNLSRKDTKEIDISSRIYEALFGSSGSKNTDKSAPMMLIASGDAFGIKINEERPCVARLEKDGPFELGDRILKLGGSDIYSSKDIETVLKNYRAGMLSALVLRNGKEVELSVKPEVSEGGVSLNLVLKQSSVGIGTITFIDPSSCSFGGLGHGVCDSSGEIIDIKNGVATSVILTGIKRGESGKPGELCGALGKGVLGEISTNSECGIFGTLMCMPLSEEDAIPVGTREHVKAGKAEIISTLKNGKKASYEIEICDIDYTSQSSKSFKIKVTDEALLAISGGIVRGMSGSPIIQDGKLVGAVTHVMVADPTEGYGIFIENMLNAANNQTQQKAA